MPTLRLKSSIIATALAGAVVFAAVATGTVTLLGNVVTGKSDRLTLPISVSCTADCGIASRGDLAFRTVAEHDADNGITTLTRVPTIE